MRIGAIVVTGTFTLNALALDSFSYSGRLVNSSGVPVTGEVKLRFDIRSSVTVNPTTLVCTKEIDHVPLSQGLFHVKLKFDSGDCFGNPFQNIMETAYNNGHQLSYQVTDLNNTRTYAEQAMYAVPSSFMANYAKKLSQNGATNGQALVWNNGSGDWVPSSVLLPANVIAGLGVTITNTAGQLIISASGGSGSVTNVTGVLPISVNTGATTPEISISQADTITNGYLSSTDWNTFNNKQDSLASGASINGITYPVFGQTLQVPLAPVGLTDVVNLQALQDAIDGVTTTLQWTTSGTDIHNNNTGNVGIGTALPAEKLDVIGNIAVTGNLRFKDSGSNYVELRAPITTAGVTFTLPAADGTNGQVLKTDGSGNLSWGNSSVGSGDITDGSIVDADVSATAAIDQSKIANLTTDLAGKEPSIAAGTAAQYWRGDKTWQALNTDVVLEGATNKYYTDTLARGSLSASSPISYNSGTGVIGMVAGTTGDLLQYDGTSWVPWAPNFLTSEADTLATVTGRGATTATALTLSGGASFPGSGIWNASGNVGIGTNTPRSALDVAGGVQIGNDAALCAATKVGTLRYSGGNVEYCNGASWLAFGVSGSGITNINGSSVGAHSFAVPGATGTAPNWVTVPATGVHTLNIPMASDAGVTAGLVSKTDYDAFNAKLGTSTTLSGDVTGTYNSTVVEGIQGTPVVINTLTNGNILKFNGTNWINTALTTADLGSGVLPVSRGGTNTSSLVGDRIMVSTPTAIVEAAALTDGQLLIGATGAAPVASTLTAGTGVTITNSAGGITIAATGSGGTVTDVSGTAPISVATGTTTPVVSISQANTTTDGYLSSTDWNTFNNKQSSLSAGVTINGVTYPANATLPMQVTLAPVNLTDVVNKQYVDSFGQWGTSAGNVFRTSGNVGIGTSTPTQKLSVAGTIESTSGGIKFPDGTIQTSAIQPFVMGGTFVGTLESSQILMQFPFPINVIIPAGCANSRFEVATATTSSVIVTLEKCTGAGFSSCTQIGTATISASGKVASFNCASATSFVAGADSLVIKGPAAADTTAGNAGWSIYGTR